MSKKIGKSMIHITKTHSADTLPEGAQLVTLCGLVKRKKHQRPGKIYLHCEECLQIILEEHRVMADTLHAMESASRDGARLFRAASLRLSDVRVQDIEVVNEDDSTAPPATMTAEELSILLDSDVKTVRRFLRHVTPRDEHPGKGGVWSVDILKIPELTRKYYTEWLQDPVYRP